DPVCRRIEAIGLAEDTLEQRHALEIGDAYALVLAGGVDLARQLDADLGMLSEELERPRDGGCGGLVSGEEPRHDLVLQRAPRDRTAGALLSVLEAREEVVVAHGDDAAAAERADAGEQRVRVAPHRGTEAAIEERRKHHVVRETQGAHRLRDDVT